MIARALPTHQPLVVALLATVAGVGAGLTVTVWPTTTLVTLLLLGLTAVAVLRQPAAGVMLFAAIATVLPFAVLPIRLVFAPTLVDVTLLLLLASWALRILVHDEPFVPTHVDGLLVLLVGCAVVSFVIGYGYAPVASEDTRLYLKLLGSMLLYFGVVQAIRDDGQVTQVVRVLILGGAAAAMMALLLYTLPRDVAVDLMSSLGGLGYPTGPDVVRTVAGTDTLRATGTSVDPNVLGGLLMVSTLLFAAQTVARRPILPRASLVLMGIVMAAAIALTYSRSAWVGLAAGLAYLAVVKERRLLVVGALALGGLLLLPQTQPFVGRFTAGLELRDQATLMRLDEYRNALAIIGQYPLFGIGFGEAPSIELSVGVSSLYLLIAEQMGLVGLATFLVLILVAAVDGLRLHVPRASPRWATVSGLQAALVGALVAGLFDHYFFNLRFPHMVALFWLLLGLLSVVRSLSQETRSPRVGTTAAQTAS